MTNFQNSPDLDGIFEALANKHRREMIYALGLQPHSISRLASIRRLSLPAIHKHVKLLEASGLILRKKTGQTNFLTLNRETFYVLQKWTMQFHPYWGNNNETLENYEKYQNEKVKNGGEKK